MLYDNFMLYERAQNGNQMMSYDNFMLICEQTSRHYFFLNLFVDQFETNRT